MEELSKLSSKYGLPDLNSTRVSDQTINMKVKGWSRLRIFSKSQHLKKAPTIRPGLRSEAESFSTVPPIKYEALKSYYLGLLVTKTGNQHFLRKKFQGDKTCLHDVCQERDDFDHWKNCAFYNRQLFKSFEYHTSINLYHSSFIYHII